MTTYLVFSLTIVFYLQTLYCTAQLPERRPLPPRPEIPQNDKKSTLKSITTSIDIKLYQPWTSTGILVHEGDKVDITANGTMNFYTGKCNECTSTPNGRTDCNHQGFYFDTLACWSLVGSIGQYGPFQVGSSYHAISKSTGELLLGVNDTQRDYGDNTGSWTANVEVTEKATGETCQVTSYPQQGDVEKLIFHPQEGNDWCWAAVAELLMEQASQNDILQCTQLTKVIYHNSINCCENKNKYTDVGGDTRSSLDAFNFTYTHKAAWGPGESEIVKEIGTNKRPIAFRIAYQDQVNILKWHSHWEVIYGYTYTNGELYIRIWDPQIKGHFRCERFKDFPAPIDNLQIRVTDYVYNVNKSPS